jgi:hypothetical protein
LFRPALGNGSHKEKGTLPVRLHQYRKNQRSRGLTTQFLRLTEALFRGCCGGLIKALWYNGSPVTTIRPHMILSIRTSLAGFITGSTTLELRADANSRIVVTRMPIEAHAYAIRRSDKRCPAASQPAATTIGLIFVGALSAFFDQDR